MVGRFLLCIIKVKTPLKLHSDQQAPKNGAADSDSIEGAGAYRWAMLGHTEAGQPCGSDLRHLFLGVLEAGCGVRVAPGENSPGLQLAAFSLCPRTWGQVGRQTETEGGGELWSLLTRALTPYPQVPPPNSITWGR